jgi:hypothetical protein
VSLEAASYRAGRHPIQIDGIQGLTFSNAPPISSARYLESTRLGRDGRPLRAAALIA